MNEADVLEAAAKYIERYGHIKGRYGGKYFTTEDAPACASGAMDAVSPDIHLAYNSRDILAEYLGGYEVIGSIPRWNDRPERTAQEVVDALRGAAREVRNGS